MNLFCSLPAESVAEARALELRAQTERLDGTLRTSEALVRSGRQVDLRTLNTEVGRLCAASLDLPPEQGRALRPSLTTLLERLDALETALRATGAGL